MRILLPALTAVFTMSLQMCTPVFAQSEAGRGVATSEGKTAEAHAKKKLAKEEAKKAKRADRQPNKANDKNAQEALTKPDQDPTAKEDKIGDTETQKAVFEKKSNEPSELSGPEVISDDSKAFGRTLGAARLNRQDTKWTVAANYSLFDMWTLTKYGLTVGYNKDATTTYEFGYSRGSLGFGYYGINLGSIDEQRLSAAWRTYGQRNSFSFVTGIYYNELDLHLGSAALDTVMGSQRSRVDLLKINTVGLSWGIGNRWQTKSGFVWGGDWVTISVPVWIVKQEHPFVDATNNERYREEAQDALKFFRRIPELAALKVQLGFSF